MKKWIAAILAAAMVCLGSVPALAAEKQETPKSETPYTVEVRRAKMYIKQGDAVVETYEMRSSDFSITNGKEKGTIAVRFWDESGKQRKINIGAMEELRLYGRIYKLTMNKQLTPDLTVVITKDCTVSDMRVNNAGTVDVFGTVKEVDISNKKACVTEERKGEIREVLTVSERAVKGVFSEHITVYDPDEE